MRFDEWLHVMLFLKQPSLSFPSFPCMVSTGHVLSSTRQPSNQNGWFFSISNPASPLSLYLSDGLLSPKIQRNYWSREEPERERRQLGLGRKKPVTCHTRHVTQSFHLSSLIFVSSIFGRKNLLQIFRRPHWCCSRPHSVMPGHQPEAATLARFHDWSHHHFLLRMNSELWKASCGAEQYLWMQHAWSTLRGKLLT